MDSTYENNRIKCDNVQQQQQTCLRFIYFNISIEVVPQYTHMHRAYKAKSYKLTPFRSITRIDYSCLSFNALNLLTSHTRQILLSIRA